MDCKLIFVIFVLFASVVSETPENDVEGGHYQRFRRQYVGYPVGGSFGLSNAASTAFSSSNANTVGNGGVNPFGGGYPYPFGGAYPYGSGGVSNANAIAAATANSGTNTNSFG